MTKKTHSKIPVKTQNQTCNAIQRSIIKLDPSVEKETLSLVLAAPYPGRLGCCWEISQADYCYKKSFIWLFKQLMSAPSTLKRTHVRLQIREQTEGLQAGIKEKQTY